MRRLLRVLVGVAVTVWSVSGAASTADPPARRAFVGPYVHHAWGIEDGLPQSSVNVVVQTRDGYLWLGTLGGLARFDGVSFTVFATGTTPGLASNRILALLEARDGSVWIGTEDGGLTRYRDGRFVTYTTANGLPSNLVRSMGEDRDGALWLATPEGAVRYRDGTFTTFAERDGLADRDVRVVRPDQQGNVWVGTWRAGLFRIRDGVIAAALPRAGTLADQVRAIHAGRDGTLWVGTGAGLLRLQMGHVRTYGVADGLPSPVVDHVTEDRSGALWIGTERGLARLAGDRLTAFTVADGLPDVGVNHVAEDREGNLWVGTDVGGLSRLKAPSLVMYGAERGMPSHAVVPIVEDPAGAIWMGVTCGGLVKLHDGRLSTLDFAGRRADACVWSLAADADGGLWIGTWGAGLFHARGGRITSYTEANSDLPSNVVLALFRDRDGTLWIGTSQGLSALRDGAFRTYRRRDGLVHDDVRFVTQARDGALLIGTPGGFSRFHDGRFTSYTTANGLSHNFVRAIHEDAAGALWLGTYGGGLNRFKDGRFVPLTTANGLFDDTVSRILEDGEGRLWMCGNRGIFRVARRELDAVADHAATSFATVSYGVADGMTTNECSGGGQPAGWAARDGRLWFPTIKGAVAIDPRSTTTNVLPPPVRVERVSVDGAPVDASPGIRLAPDDRTLEVQYAGLSFVAPEKVRFRYRLLGLDPAWIDAGVRRTVQWSYLPAGTYSFQVTAANNDGVWNPAPATLAIVVVPPLWKTWWFSTAVAAAALAGIGFVSHRRLSALREDRRRQIAFARQLIDSQERERKRIAAELHDSLGQNLLVIKNRALVGLSAPGDQGRLVEQLDHISTTASQAIGEVRDIAYGLRPYQLDRLGLTRTLQSMLKKVAGASGIEFVVNIDVLDDRFPGDAAMTPYRIVQEAVTNIVRHAGATRADVTMAAKPRHVDVIITDNGKGFTPNAPVGGDPAGGGFGLVGIAERATLSGGHYAIESAPGRGTTIRVTLPTGRAQDAQE